MITCILFDFSRVLLFPKDESYTGGLNKLNRILADQPGYSILDHFRLNEELLAYLRILGKSRDIYIFTSETIQDAPEFAPHLASAFKGVYSATKLSTSKKLPEAYEIVLKDLNKKPEEVLFVDDNKGNIEAASLAGLHTILYTSNAQLFSELEKKLQ
ncbi:MAG: HAD-IA family hydrolase [bacterium]|nr:HAD-IA family hydrolase [bacterium]